MDASLFSSMTSLYTAISNAMHSASMASRTQPTTHTDNKEQISGPVTCIQISDDRLGIDPDLLKERIEDLLNHDYISVSGN